MKTMLTLALPLLALAVSAGVAEASPTERNDGRTASAAKHTQERADRDDRHTSKAAPRKARQDRDHHRRNHDGDDRDQRREGDDD